MSSAPVRGRASGVTRLPRRPAGWVPPGPKPRGADGRPELEPGEGEDLCYLSGEWRIFQFLKGHRWSVDDLLAAWVGAAAGEAIGAKTHLDLGTGLGSVLLMIAWRLPAVRSVGLEAQAERAALARRSIAWNGVEERCRVVEGDLRDARALEARGLEGPSFDLITGTPPYFPRGSGTESPEDGIAHSRFEHHGGVEAYLEAASRWLAPAGVMVLEANALVGPRIAPAARAVGLSHERWIDVVPREGKPVLLRLDTFRKGPPREPARETLTVRDRAGQWTPEFSRIRAELGLPPVPPRSTPPAG